MKYITIILIFASCTTFGDKEKEIKSNPIHLSTEKIDSLSNQIDTLFPDYDRGGIDSENNQFNTIRPIEEYTKKKYKNIEIIVSGYDTSYTVETN